MCRFLGVFMEKETAAVDVIFFGRADSSRHQWLGFDTRKELMLDVTQDAPSKLGMEYQ